MRALIVDDEALPRERVRTLLAASPEIELIGECSGGRAAIAAIIDKRPELVFLDIQMPDVNGFEVLEAVADEWLPAVIFVTAHDEYAVKAFDVHAVDYLLKPIEPERFARAVTRALASKRRDTSRLLKLLDAVAARAPESDRLVIRSRGKVLVLRALDIDWIEADGKHAVLHAGRETHVIRQQLRRLEERLAPHGFVRVHRSAIVNTDRIRELEPWFHGEYVVVLKDGTKLTSSAAHSRALHQFVDRSGL